MDENTARVVLVAAPWPYLGGRATWSRVIEGLKSSDIFIIDSTELIEARNIREALVTKLRLSGASLPCVFVGHGLAAAAVVEAACLHSAPAGIVLISPILAGAKAATTLRMLSKLFAFPMVGQLLNAYASSKLRRFRSKSGRLEMKKAMRLFFGRNYDIPDDVLSDALVAIQRPEAVVLGRRAAELASSQLVSVQLHSPGRVQREVTVVRGRADAFTRRRPAVLKAAFPIATVVDVDGGSAIMVENPQPVSDVINEMCRSIASVKSCEAVEGTSRNMF